MIEYTLSVEEQEIAKLAAQRRHEIQPNGYVEAPMSDESVRKDEKTVLLQHLNAVGAEIAFARLSNNYWNGLWQTGKVRKIPDVLPDYDVRWNDYAGGHCIIRPTDEPSWRYIRVTGQFPKFKIVGGIRGKDAMLHREWVRSPNGKPPAWFVPESGLTSVWEDK